MISWLFSTFCPTEMKMAPPSSCEKNMSDVPMGTSTVCNTVCAARLGAWNVMPRPKPYTNWYATQLGCGESTSSMVRRPAPTAMMQVPKIMNGV